MKILIKLWKMQLEIKQNFVRRILRGFPEFLLNVVREITNEETSLIKIGSTLFEKTLFEKIATEGPQIETEGMRLLEKSQPKISANEFDEDWNKEEGRSR
jgi:hypothetical protein